MKLLHHIQGDNLSNLFLYAAIMVANIDYKGVADYVIKAVLGGAVWFGFKLLQDHYSEKVKHNVRKQLKDKEENKTDEK
jgi:hypothetical protein